MQNPQYLEMIKEGEDKFEQAILAILIDEKLLSPEAARQAQLEARDKDYGAIYYIIDNEIVAEESYLASIGSYLEVEWVKENEIVVAPDVLKIVPQHLAKLKCFMPLGFEKNVLKLAMNNPLDEKLIQALERHTSSRVKPLLASELAIRKYIKSLCTISDFIDRTDPTSGTSTVVPERAEMPTHSSPADIIINDYTENRENQSDGVLGDDFVGQFNQKISGYFVEKLKNLGPYLDLKLIDEIKDITVAVLKRNTVSILVYARRILEGIVSSLVAAAEKKVKKAPLMNQIEYLKKQDLIPAHIYSHMHYIRVLGNLGAHVKDSIALTSEDISALFLGIISVVEHYANSFVGSNPVSYLLLVEIGPYRTAQLLEPEREYLIGKGTECDINLNDEGVSRHHATIKITKDGPFIKSVDEGAKITVNSQVIDSKGFNLTGKSKDTLVFGSCKCELETIRHKVLTGTIGNQKIRQLFRELAEYLQKFSSADLTSSEDISPFVSQVVKTTGHILQERLAKLFPQKQLSELGEIIDFLRQKKKIAPLLCPHLYYIAIFSDTPASLFKYEDAVKLCLALYALLDKLSEDTEKKRLHYFFCWKIGEKIMKRGLKPGYKYTIGRGYTCDINLGNAYHDISRVHASIEITPEGPVVEDLNSQTGTWVNSQKITNLRLTATRGTIVKLGQNCKCLIKVCPDADIDIQSLDKDISQAFTAPSLPKPSQKESFTWTTEKKSILEVTILQLSGFLHDFRELGKILSDYREKVDLIIDFRRLEYTLNDRNMKSILELSMSRKGGRRILLSKQLSKLSSRGDLYKGRIFCHNEEEALRLLKNEMPESMFTQKQITSPAGVRVNIATANHPIDTSTMHLFEHELEMMLRKSQNYRFGVIIDFSNVEFPPEIAVTMSQYTERFGGVLIVDSQQREALGNMVRQLSLDKFIKICDSQSQAIELYFNKDKETSEPVTKRKFIAKVDHESLPDNTPVEIARIHGEIGNPQILDFRDEIVQLMKNKRKLVLDLSQVGYVNCTSFGELLIEIKDQEEEKTVLLFNEDQNVIKPLEFLGLDAIWEFYTSEKEAINSLLDQSPNPG